MTAPLTAPDLRVLADRLRARHGELRSSIRDQFADHDDPGTMALRNRLEDTDDWAVADAMQGFDIAMVARDVAEIGEVERALKRLADGSYGRCIDCDETDPDRAAARLPVGRALHPLPGGARAPARRRPAATPAG